MEKVEKNYDLEKRTIELAVKTIRLCKTVTRNVITVPIISQLVRSVTSIGANYREANGAISKKDFRSKIFICKKEARETEYWLELITEVSSDENWPVLKQEVHELILIFSKITRSLKDE